MYADLPSYIPENLNQALSCARTQEEAFENFITYFENDGLRQRPTQVLFHMATRRGKTLIVAGAHAISLQEGIPQLSVLRESFQYR